jgi:hypothetical protein
MVNPTCQHCEKPIVTIGNRRQNGRNMNDWDNRPYHKKCWSLLTQMRERIRANNRILGLPDNHKP